MGVDTAHTPLQGLPNVDSNKRSDDRFLAIQLYLDDLHRGDWCRRFEREELVRRFGPEVLRM